MPYTDTFGTKTSPTNMSDLDRAFQETANGLFTGNIANYSFGTIGYAIASLIAQGADPATINQLIQAATAGFITQNSPFTALNFAGFNSSLVTYPGTNQTVTAVLDALRAGQAPASANAPTIDTAPTVAFPGSTGDPGETFTITAGSLGNTANTGATTSYQVQIGANLVGGTFTTLTGNLPTANSPLFATYFGGTRQFRVNQIINWNNGAPVQRSSIFYTLNAPPVVPVVTIPPSWGAVAPAINANIPVNAGVATGANTIALMVNSGYVDINNLGTTRVTFNASSFYTPDASDGGKQLAIIEVATNANGSSQITASSISSPIIIPSATGAPQWIDATANAALLSGAVAPAFDKSVYAVGEVFTGTWGTTIGNVDSNGYTLQLLRDGALPAFTTLTGANALNFNYTPQSIDGGHTISGIGTASSIGGGTSRPVPIPGVVIAGTANLGGGGGGNGGSGSGGLLSGSVTTVADNTANTPYVLSTIGSTDWLAFTNGSLASPVKKNGSPNRITVTENSGATIGNNNTSHSNYWVSYANGVGNVSATSDGYVQIANNGGPCDIDIEISGVSTAQELVTLFFDMSTGDTISIVASNSDGSASNWTYNANPGGFNVMVQIAIKGGSGGQVTSIHLRNTTGNSGISLEGVTLGT